MNGARVKQILHVDMDAFFASVEMRDDPRLRGRPVLVGFPGKRGVVAAASYEARRFGCHSAQPMAVALRRCPDAVVVPPRHGHYSAVSREVFEVFREFTPLVEGLSIDEAFLDVTGTERLHGSARDVAVAIRARVRQKTALTCSVGISTAKFIAKIASDQNKPDGLTEVLPGEEQAFLEPLPIRELWGVGPKTAEFLATKGVRTIGDLATIPGARLEETLGEHGAHLHRLSLGIDPRDVVPGHRAKSISHEMTVQEDLVGRPALQRAMLDQATRVADRLVHQGLRGRKVQIKIRDVHFDTRTRQCTLDAPTDEAAVIWRSACALLEKIPIRGRRFRLIGVGVGQLTEVEEPAQLSLGVDPVQTEKAERETKAREVQGLMTAVRDRFGGRALFPGLVDEDVE